MAEGKKTFSWGAVVNAEPSTSLADVMSEELAQQLQIKEFQPYDVPSDTSNSSLKNPNRQVDEDAPTTADDHLIAQLLQKQYDEEFDNALVYEENHLNGTSKVRVSYSKYRMVPEEFLCDDSDDELEKELQDMEDKKRDWDRFETHEKEVGAMARCGYKKMGEKIITKHDEEMSQRGNAKKIMEFPPGISTGDGGGFDMLLSNKVYNKIRNFSVKEGKRKNRIQDKEERAVAEQALDPQTRVLLFKMVNNGVLESVNGIISTGKEAVIIHAEGGPGPDHLEEPLNVPKECAIKVFKTTLNEFKTRDKYIRDDYRFRDRFSKQNPRKVIHMWAEKELHNLMKMGRGGLRVPEVVMLKKHVLVMSFIGSEGRPAPKLKEAAEKMHKADLISAYAQIEEMMIAMYSKCQLVHADLSEYNILWHDGDCWFIDVSQSVEPIHPNGLFFLFRDCRNISRFFTRHGIDVPTEYELFTKITELPLEPGSDDEIVSVLEGYNTDQVQGRKAQQTEDDGSEGRDRFNDCWERSLSQGDENSVGSSAPVTIPGHHKPRSDKMTLPKMSKSPKSPGREIVGMTDESLHSLKKSLVASKETNSVEEASKTVSSSTSTNADAQTETSSPEDAIGESPRPSKIRFNT